MGRTSIFDPDQARLGRQDRRGVMHRLAALFLTSVIVIACTTTPTPPIIDSARPTIPNATPKPSVATLEPSLNPVPEPTPSAEATVSAGPAYVVDGYGPPQKPGTIIFGSPVDGGLSPYVGWPEAGLMVGDDYAFGAFWGEPANAAQIQ